jgi:hypothetical protein
VSQDNVIKMARQVKVFAPPARGSKRFCCNTGFVCLMGGEFWQLTMPPETPVGAQGTRRLPPRLGLECAGGG